MDDTENGAIREMILRMHKTERIRKISRKTIRLGQCKDGRKCTKRRNQGKNSRTQKTVNLNIVSEECPIQNNPKKKWARQHATDEISLVSKLLGHCPKNVERGEDQQSINRMQKKRSW